LVISSQLLSVSGSLTIIAAVGTSLFISEKIIDRSLRLSLVEVLMRIPKYLSNKSFLKFLIFIVFTHATPCFVSHLIGQHLLGKKFDRALYTNVELIIQPLMIIASIFVFRLVVKGRIIRLYLVSQTLHLTIIFMTLLTLISWEETHNRIQTFCMLVGANLFGLIGVPETFLFAFANLIVDESLGNTGLSIVQAVFSITGTVPQTVGLLLLKHFEFYHYAFVILAISAGILVLAIKPSIILDKLDIKSYTLLLT